MGIGGGDAEERKTSYCHREFCDRGTYWDWWRDEADVRGHELHAAAHGGGKRWGAAEGATQEIVDAMQTAIPFLDDSLSPAVRAFCIRRDRNGDGLILTHGAGSDCSAPLLVALSEAFAGEGYVVLRCDLPFRRSGGRGRRFRAAQNGTERDCEMRCGFAGEGSEPNVSGRHSYGGRQATILAPGNRIWFRIAVAFLSAASAAQAGTTADTAFARFAHSEFICAWNARSFRKH